MKPNFAIRMGVIALTLVAGVAAADMFTWTGGGANDDWDDTDNWSSSALSQFPDDSNDDADVPSSGSPWDVDLISDGASPDDPQCYHIEDLTIEGDVDFGDGSNDDAVLCVDSLIITGEAVVTINDGAKILTE